MLNLIIYLVFIVLALFFIPICYFFLKYLSKKPLLLNNYAEFIPSQSILDNIVKNKNASYSSVIQLLGFSYYKEDTLEHIIEDNFKLRDRALNFNDLQEKVQIKFIFKRFAGMIYYFIEVTNTEITVVKNTTNALKSSLSEYKPSILSNKELLEFLFFNANLVQKSLNDNQTSINDLCSYSDISFADNHGVLENIDTKKHFKCFSFNFGSTIDTNYFGKLLASNLEFDFIINSKFFTKIQANSLVNTDNKNISSSEADPSQKPSFTSLLFDKLISRKKKQETVEVQEILENDEANLAVCDVFIILFADNAEELELSENKLKDLINRYEISLIEEKKILSFFFLQRLVGFRLHHTWKFLSEDSDLLVYAHKVLSSTVAGMFDLIEPPKGLDKTDWGDKPLAVFNTHYNSLYNFNLHIQNQGAVVGHGVIVAPTGGGKTTFIQYIMKCILDNYVNDIDIYSFDRHNGMKIFTNWQKGNDISFEHLSINPLQIDLNDEDNIRFLQTFLFMISKAENAQEKQILNDFIGYIKLQPMENRILKVLVKDGLADGNLKDKFHQWTDGKYANYINSTTDEMNLKGVFFNFQLDVVLEDEILTAPIIYYIMFKIRQKAKKTGRGHFVFIDEAAKMIKNEYFAQEIKVLLYEHRKLRGCVWLAFQNPDSFLEDASIKSLILGQCQNQIIFPSSSIKQDTLEKLDISKSVYKEVFDAQKYNNNPYFVLLKNPNENVILDINLKSKLGDDLKFLSSTTKDVLKMEELKKEYGDEWVSYF